MVAPRALVFRSLVKGNEDSGDEIEGKADHFTRGSVHRRVTYNFSHATWFRHGKFSTSALSIVFFFLAFWASTRIFLYFGELKTNCLLQ